MNDTRPDKSRGGLARIARALGWSLAGLVAAVRHEAAFRQELAIAVPLAAVAVVLPVTGTQRALLLLAILGVLVVELLNSAVEAVVDRVSMEHHALAGRAKDMGSAAVLLSLVGCVLVWGLVLADVYAG